MQTAIAIAVIASIGTVVALAVAAYERAVRREWEAVAAAQGWQYSAGDPLALADLPFPVLRRGHDQHADHTLAFMLSDGKKGNAFAFRKTIGSGRSSHTEKHSCVAIRTGDRFPLLTIEHEGLLGQLRDVAGIHDIQFESEEFNRTFKIDCEDVRFAQALIDQRFMAFLLDHPMARVGIAWRGPHLLAWSDQMLPEELPSLVAFADLLRQAVPSVVRELYPPM